jgi:hypothetical protein
MKLEKSGIRKDFVVRVVLMQGAVCIMVCHKDLCVYDIFQCGRLVFCALFNISTHKHFYSVKICGPCLFIFNIPCPCFGCKDLFSGSPLQCL